MVHSPILILLPERSSEVYRLDMHRHKISGKALFRLEMKIFGRHIGCVGKMLGGVFRN